jgi:hypothetical protein
MIGRQAFRRAMTVLAAGAFAAAIPATAFAQSEGINVRGEWTIVIRNEDGSVASRHEFRNAFVPSLGGPLLANLLKNISVVAEWMISMQGFACLNASGQPGNCILVLNPGWQAQGPEQFFPTLTTAVPTSGPNAGKFVLTGSAKAARTASVTTVATFGLECPASSTTCNGLGAPQRTFTSHFIGNPGIPVVQGQTIDVNVVISFS